jgi:16S rRNA (cytosine967-C5)-methyltransferase
MVRLLDMTPGARLAAAIEVLDHVLGKRRAADVALSEWARANRFAGSGDRRAIEGRVYCVLRRRNECAAAMSGHDDARALVLGSLRLEGLDPEKIENLLQDGPHAPGPPSPGERTLLQTAMDDAPPLWTALNYPEWLHPELARSLGGGLAGEMEAMQARAALDLRANALKTDRRGAKAALARDGVETDESALAPHALRVRGHAKLDAVEAFLGGLVEVQDAASQAVCEMVQARPGDRIVDLCAGAGGKSLALAAAMKNQGAILACDVDGKRLGRLAPRAVRAGATIVELTGDPYTDHPHLTPGVADAALVDAPCSGSGTWRRNPEAKWTLDAERLTGYRNAQAQALDRAVQLVRPGGRILYATCSLLKSEGEDQVDAALTRHAGWRTAAMRRFSPAATDTDGFFAALLVSAP